MYIIAIAWLFVVVLTAIANPRPLGGLLTFLFAGLLPLTLFLWLFGTPARRRRRQAHNAAEATEAATAQTVSAASQTDEANRPVTPSRRYE